MAPSHAHHNDHTHARDVFGNPKHLQSYLRRLLSPERDEWQMPERVVRALEIEKGQTIGEIGAGPGYFTPRLARAVGRTGAVLAVEVEPKLIAILRDRLQEKRIKTVTPILALAQDPLLPPRACDLILAVNVMHHVHGLAAYLRRLTKALKPGGRIVDIDFAKHDLPVGPPVAHKLSREEVLRAAGRAGLRLVAEPTFLPHQYFLVLAERA